MKDKLNIIKINGFTGIFIALFLLCCVAEGIIVFPSWLLVHAWNFVAGFFDNMPYMTLIHGVLLWAIIALSTYAIMKDRKPISYQTPSVISEEELSNLLRNAKNMEKITPIIKEENKEKEIKH